MNSRPGCSKVCNVLQKLVDLKVSDIHLRPAEPVFYRQGGRLFSVRQAVFSAAEINDFWEQIAAAPEKTALQEKKEADFAWLWAGSRFRVHAFLVQGQLSLVFRYILPRIPSLQELGCPALWQKYVRQKDGLILVCGSTGEGKTTTLASFIETVNQQRAAHILCLEDPVEYLHQSKLSLISQCEYQKDFFSFAGAVRSALRADPDIILLGELRDRETAEAALQAAETGHLVLATLHTKSAADSVDRILNFFPLSQQNTAAALLASVLEAVFVQHLVQAKNNRLVCATEIMVRNSAVSNLIRTGKTAQLVSVLQTGKKYGMQTMAMAMEELRRKYELEELPDG